MVWWVHVNPLPPLYLYHFHQLRSMICFCHRRRRRRRTDYYMFGLTKLHPKYSTWKWWQGSKSKMRVAIICTVFLAYHQPIWTKLPSRKDLNVHSDSDCELSSCIEDGRPGAADSKSETDETLQLIQSSGNIVKTNQPCQLAKHAPRRQKAKKFMSDWLRSYIPVICQLCIHPLDPLSIDQEAQSTRADTAGFRCPGRKSGFLTNRPHGLALDFFFL